MSVNILDTYNMLSGWPPTLTAGNHQLEVAQLNIKLREVVAELEEVQYFCSQHHTMQEAGGRDNSADGEGGNRREGESEEHIYEEPPEEVSVQAWALIAIAWKTEL